MKLLAATQSGNAHWVAASDTVFVFSGPGTSVSLSSLDGDGRPPVRLEVLNANGEVVKSANSETVYNDQTDQSSLIDTEWNKSLHSLYELAQDSATGAKAAIASLIEYLDADLSEPLGRLREQIRSTRIKLPTEL
jgi:hypothetical protein